MTDAAAAGAPPRLDPPVLPIRTRRLVLRAVTKADTAAIGDYCADPEVTRYLPFGALEGAALDERVAKLVAATTPSAPGEFLALAVEHDGVLVGDLMLRLAERIDDTSPPATAEIGWVFAPAHGGRGFATEAAAALVDLAFAHYPLHRLFAKLDPRNDRSARLCERIGMRGEAHLRRDYPDKDGTWGDTLVYGLLREEWAAAR